MRAADPMAWTIKGYQHLISPLTPPSCRFHPSCSQYTMGAIRTHGPIKGGVLGAYRILCCNPFHPGGFDPVPPADLSLGEALRQRGTHREE